MPESSIQTVLVLGAGTMGNGIAQVCAMAGYHVTLHDPQPEAVKRALSTIRGNLDKGVERGKVTADARDTALANLRDVAHVDEAASDADLVIEAVPERMEIKTSIFSQLDRSAPPHAILATNTSSLSVSRIAAATARPDRVIGLHFFNPVHIMKLLEVVRGRETSAETVDAGLEFARRIGKEPIVVTDTPGFASSRLGVILGLEAMRMVEQGVASPQDIDKAMELGYNHPMGPLKLTDLVGLDVRLGIADYLHGELGGDQYRAPELLRSMVAEGKLGKKSGQGFYDWTQEGR
ncbi:3-hydroxyacyl-CoA dehydrogenase family protein [Longimicrobium terrae]|uniref:3-hydroxybutyryl-CoA dehydrogenase n=1 Tax=Longimicrobium terrae TaxID=1639882 RepID=A0A841H4U6_9BACT|nr:3-hydroxyacyl-CoA dehydrogenase family protein [Longimicrobium terrae]MBB4638759.1 3-hydroxybutyryl-CoA dehydrogenase [Longimicrobium terrae]MBB6072998.1 3-hydroxybutyryl-CoA dehydrogenase [Longimicrobium terrae]